MKLKKCPNGHYYDEEKYATCPHCASGGGNSGSNIGEGDVTQSLFGAVTSHAAPGVDNDVTERLVPGSSRAGEEDVTVPLGSGTVNLGGFDDGEKTVGFYPMTEDEEHGAKPKPVTELVVGWLVCVEGSNFGKSYELHAGKNFVGRDRSMDVCLTGDNAVSRSVHAIIIYEPKNRKFFAQSGDAHSLFYLNESVVLSSEELKDHDLLEIGQTKLFFVPFCDERFGWDK